MARIYEEVRPATEDEVERYIDDLEDIRRQLEDVGVCVEGEMLLGRIKRSLPPSFRPLLAALQLQRSYVSSGNEYSYVVDEIKLWCQQTKMEAITADRQYERGERQASQTALRTTTTGRRITSGRTNVQCYYCLGPHRKDECALYKRDQERAIKEAAGTGNRGGKGEVVQTVREFPLRESLF